LAWLDGQAGTVSIDNIAAFLKKEKITGATSVVTPKNMAKVEAMLKKNLPLNLPKTEQYTNCNNVFFLPQPYFPDDEILTALVDHAPHTKRAFPKALDIFATFGSQSAFHKLFVEYQEDTVWLEYPGQLAKMKDKFQNFPDRNVSSRNKRLECLLTMTEKQKNLPVAFTNKAWDGKNLTSASASWVKLRHNALLFGKAPNYPEPADSVSAVADTLPSPVRIGYVEPNFRFWQKLREWVELTDNTLKKYNMTNDSINRRTALMHRYIARMEDASA
jgi:hypothetical protein